MSSHSFENSITYKISKQHCFQENPKILKAIHNKMTPLNVSPKIKLKMQREKESCRPTFHQFSYNRMNWENKVKNEEQNFGRRNSNCDDLSYLNKCSSMHKKVYKIGKSMKVRECQQIVQQSFSQTQKIHIYRLPFIKKDIQKKKSKLAKSIQANSLQLQRDSFRPIDEQKVCNLQYLVNRLNVSHKNGQGDNIKNQVLRGYENLSPNRLKEYIDLFKNKMKVHPQSIYVSKKRIALPRTNTQRSEEQEISVNFKSIYSRNEKKSDKISRKELKQKKMSSRKSSASKREIKKISEKKKSIK